MSLLRDPPPYTAIPTYPFPIPTSKPVVFESIFRPSGDSGKAHLAEATKLRNDMLDALKANSSPEAVCMAIEAYLPSLFSLTTIILVDPDMRLNDVLSFSWTSDLYKKHASTYYLPAIQLEVVQVLSALAAAKQNHAAKALEEVTSVEAFDDVSKLAGTLLREAAGLMDFVADYLASCSADTAVGPSPWRAMAMVFVAQAQLLAVRKGALKGTSAGLLGKLALDAHAKAGRASACLQGDGLGLSPLYGKFCESLQSLARGIACKHLAQHSVDADSYGTAVGFALAAEKLVNECATSKELPRLTKVVEEEKKATTTQARVLSKKNAMVYFEKVVAQDLLEFPEAKALMAAIPYVPPTLAFDAI